MSRGTIYALCFCVSMNFQQFKHEYLQSSLTVMSIFNVRSLETVAELTQGSCLKEKEG